MYASNKLRLASLQVENTKLSEFVLILMACNSIRSMKLWTQLLISILSQCLQPIRSSLRTKKTHNLLHLIGCPFDVCQLGISCRLVVLLKLGLLIKSFGPWNLLKYFSCRFLFFLSMSASSF